MIQGIQGTQAYQQIMDAQLLTRASQAVDDIEREKIKDEFLAIFYKELLKQSFKAPRLGMTDEETSLAGTFSADIMMDQMALQLAQSSGFSADDLWPAATERKALTE